MGKKCLSFENKYGKFIEGVYPREIFNNITMTSLRDYVDKATSMFYYENLPVDLTSRVIELSLLFRYNLCFWYSEALDKVVLCMYIYENELDIYLQPNKVKLMALNGSVLAMSVDFKDIVPIRDNVMGIPYIFPLLERVESVEIAQLTFDICMFMLRFPVAFECESKEMASQVKEVFKQIKDFTPAVFTSKSKVLEKIHNMDIKPNANVNELYLTIQNMIRLLLNSIGINSDISKKERLVEKELESNDDFVNITYYERYQQRKLAVDECNKRWGTNIVLKELKKDIDEYLVKKEKAQEGDDNNVND